jgi:hypothetical protein
MSKTLPLINADNADPRKRKTLISDLEASLLAVLALAHPQRVDAIDAFCALWQIKKIPTMSLSEAMTMLIIAMTSVEEMGYGVSQTEGAIVYYSLTPSGVAMLMGDGDIRAAVEMHALMGADRMAGGKPC